MKTDLHAFNLKKQQRLNIRKSRQALNPQEAKLYANACFKQLITADLLQKKQNIAIYLPFDNELDTYNIIQYCWDNEICVFLPVLSKIRPSYLQFCQFTRQTPLKKNHLGIDEPQITDENIIEIQSLDYLFMPLVAFDTRGYRLGMGGGFYDRSLAELSSSSPLKIGLAYDFQFQTSIPVESWDQPMDKVFTPSQCFNF